MSPLLLAIISFTIVMVIIYRVKPKIIFKDGKIKRFGMDEDNTLIPFPVVSIVLAIILYLIFFYIDFINRPGKSDNVLTHMSNMSQMNNIPQLSQYSQYSQTPYTYRIIKTAVDGTIIP